MRTQGPVLTPCLELNSTGRLERYQLEQKLAGVAEEAHLWGKQGWRGHLARREHYQPTYKMEGAEGENK